MCTVYKFMKFIFEISFINGRGLNYEFSNQIYFYQNDNMLFQNTPSMNDFEWELNLNIFLRLYVSMIYFWRFLYFSYFLRSKYNNFCINIYLRFTECIYVIEFKNVNIDQSPLFTLRGLSCESTKHGRISHVWRVTWINTWLAVSIYSIDDMNK